MSESVKKSAVAEQEKAEAKAEAERDRKVARRECVVDDGTAHVGRAVNGVVCSAHAMHYLADGTPRAR